MKPISKRTALSALLALSLSLLTACGSTPQTTPDPIDDLATLADGEGNLETTIEIVSVGSSAVSASGVRRQASDFLLEIEGFRATYKGKTVKGFSLSSNTPGSTQVSAAVAAGDQMKIRGRVRKVGNVPAFIGFMRSQTAGVGAAAATLPTPMILVAESKTLPTKTQQAITLTDVPVSSYAIEIGGVFAGYLRTSDGKLATFQVTAPRDAVSGLPTGIVFQAKLSGLIEWVEIDIGVVGRLKGTLTNGQQTIGLEGTVLGYEEVAF